MPSFLKLITVVCAAVLLGPFIPADKTLSNPPPQEADTIYLNGLVWTGVAGDDFAEAIAVKGERIVAIGDRAAVQAFARPSTAVIDLSGNLVVPGFIDNHTHFIYGALDLMSVNLRDVASRQEFTERISAFAKTVPDGGWITGGNWDHERWGGELPNKAWIDGITPKHPVLVSRTDGHVALANTVALKLAGINRDTPDPPGGVIVRDDQGNPTGVVKDTAYELFDSVVPSPSVEKQDAAMALAIEHALSNGVTQIYDVGDIGWRNFAAFRRVHARGQLNIRVYSFVPLVDWAKMADFVSEHGYGDDWLRWGGVKGYVDGALGSGTAWFHAPYDDAPDSSGHVINDLNALSNWIKNADEAELQVAIHAVGDKANDWLLDAYEAAILENDPGDRRFRIEHAQHLTPSAIQRFQTLGVIPSMQPYHAIDDGRWAEKKIGRERARTSYAFRSLLDAGAQVTFGSDWPVAPLSPLLGIYAAVTRRTIDGANPNGWIPQEKISVEEALRAYTINNAYAGFQEDVLGTLEAGKLADFVVLSEDIFSIDPAEISNVGVLRTVVGGQTKFVVKETAGQIHAGQK